MNFDKYMPKGLMSRLIVQLHDYIQNHKHVWHRGINIQLNNTQAEITESYDSVNAFDIRIFGSNKIELLTVIRERFGEVLKPFKDLNYSNLCHVFVVNVLEHQGLLFTTMIAYYPCGKRTNPHNVN